MKKKRVDMGKLDDVNDLGLMNHPLYVYLVGKSRDEQKPNPLFRRLSKRNAMAYLAKCHPERYMVYYAGGFGGSRKKSFHLAEFNEGSSASCFML